MKKEFFIDKTCVVNDDEEALYRERNLVVALVAKLALSNGYNCFLKRHEGDDNHANAHWVVYIELPTGQISWHIKECELPFFDFLNKSHGDWDGHDHDEKFNRIVDFLK